MVLMMDMEKPSVTMLEKYSTYARHEAMPLDTCGGSGSGAVQRSQQQTLGALGLGGQGINK